MSPFGGGQAGGLNRPPPPPGKRKPGLPSDSPTLLKDPHKEEVHAAGALGEGFPRSPSLSPFPHFLSRCWGPPRRQG